ncbi:MAG: hypothetical protein KDA85_20375, partial [Planctomycetaceae bacterium]|nr:hypothetical protein [Planctomycetaceae bacterium]
MRHRLPLVLLFAIGIPSGICLPTCSAAPQQAPPTFIPDSRLQLLTGHEGAVTAAVFTPDVARGLTAPTDQSVRFWDLGAGRELRRWTQHTGPVYSLAVSADGRIAASGGQDNSVRIWRVPPSIPDRTLLSATGPVCVATSPDGKSILTAHGEGAIREWPTESVPASDSDSAEAMSEPWQTTELHKPRTLFTVPDLPMIGLTSSMAIRHVAWRNDSLTFVTLDDAGHLLLWASVLSEPIGMISGIPDQVLRLLVSSSGQQAITVHRDGIVRVWKLNELPAPSKIALDAVETLVEEESDDSTKTQEANGDSEIPSNAFLSSTIQLEDTGIIDAVLLNNGSQLVSCAASSDIQLTDLSSGKLIRSLKLPG